MSKLDGEIFFQSRDIFIVYKYEIELGNNKLTMRTSHAKTIKENIDYTISDTVINKKLDVFSPQVLVNIESEDDFCSLPKEVQNLIQKHPPSTIEMEKSPVECGNITTYNNSNDQITFRDGELESISYFGLVAYRNIEGNSTLNKYLKNLYSISPSVLGTVTLFLVQIGSELGGARLHKHSNTDYRAENLRWNGIYVVELVHPDAEDFRRDLEFCKEVALVTAVLAALEVQDIAAAEAVFIPAFLACLETRVGGRLRSIRINIRLSRSWSCWINHC